MRKSPQIQQLKSKPDHGSTKQARNQACRGGATLANTAGKAFEKPNQVKEPKIEIRHHVYSVTIGTVL